MSEDGAEASTSIDPRTLLADWANGHDEWVRRIVRLVIGTRRRVSDADIAAAYQLFLEEKRLVDRTEPAEPEIAVELDAVDREAPLTLRSISDVSGVNALTTGSRIELNEGLTILFGENGTGKTGYARILKCMADSRTADDILSDIHHTGPLLTPHAKIEYQLGDEELTKDWSGERGETPFTRMSVFDSPAVNFHVDDDLAYVYTPASLALFNHVTHGVQGVQRAVEAEVAALKASTGSLLNRFDRGSTVYPMIETLGAASDLGELRTLSDVGQNAAEEVKTLQLAAAALRANTLGQQITLQQHVERVLSEASRFAALSSALPTAEYHASITLLAELQRDYATFREALFAAADLPAPPDPTWEGFVKAGQLYQSHLEGLSVHDGERCLYCRQALDGAAAGLVVKYQDYLEDRIATDIRAQEAYLGDVTRPLIEATLSEVEAFLAEQDSNSEDIYVPALRTVIGAAEQLRLALSERRPLAAEVLVSVVEAAAVIDPARALISEQLSEMREQSANRDQALADKESELNELEARVELKKSWLEVERRVSNAQRADKLVTLGKKIPAVLRQLTELSKTASDQLINQNFEQLFAEECLALRTPALRLEFVGRQGKAQRRKVLTGNHRPSKILSEGEQKVLAISDFLSEARLTGITAPIIFDDPVCSLDHRRIKEVADRIALLAAQNQVVVFTHDILFTTSLLARFEKSRRCSYYQVTDEDGKGKITRATGPRWDTVANLKKNLNETIAAAKKEDGEARSALVRTAYNLIRSWCEVFVEHELLADVTQRYQPNVRMTALNNIKTQALGEAIDTVVSIFEDACRYTDSHSQPLVTLGIAPTLQRLEEDWATLLACKKQYADAAA